MLNTLHYHLCILSILRQPSGRQLWPRGTWHMARRWARRWKTTGGPQHQAEPGLEAVVQRTCHPRYIFCVINTGYFIWSGLHMDSFCPLSNPFRLELYQCHPNIFQSQILGKDCHLLCACTIACNCTCTYILLCAYFANILDIDALSNKILQNQKKSYHSWYLSQAPQAAAVEKNCHVKCHKKYEENL